MVLCSRGRWGPWGRFACPSLFPGWRWVLKQRGGGAEELLTRLQYSRILRRPLQSPRLRTASFSAAGSWQAGALSRLETSEIRERTPPPPPPRRISVCGRNNCVCVRDSLHFQWRFPARLRAPNPAQRRYSPPPIWGVIYSPPAFRHHPQRAFGPVLPSWGPTSFQPHRWGQPSSSSTGSGSRQFLWSPGHRLRWGRRVGREDCDFGIGPVGCMWPPASSPRPAPAAAAPGKRGGEAAPRRRGPPRGG